MSQEASSKTEQKSTKEQIVDVATRLLQERSYNSFSYNDISDAIGIKKASIHYHFQTKEILGAEIIKNYRGKIEYLTKKLDRVESDPVVKLEKYFEYFRHGLESNLICPAGVFSVEYYTLPVEIQDEIKHLFDYYLEWLTAILDDGKEEGKFKFNEDSGQRAYFIASVLEGAMIFARAYQQIDRYENVVEMVKADLLL